MASVRSFQIEAGKGADGAASASLNKVLVEVVGVVLLVTKNGLHASDELIVVVVIKKGFAVVTAATVTVCEASAEAVEAAAATTGAVAEVAEDTLLDLVVDATNACQTGPRTFGTTAAAAATAIVVSLVSKVCKTRFLPPCSCLPAWLPICLSEAVASTTSQSQYGHSNSNKESKPRLKYVH